MITPEEPAISDISLTLFADRLRGFIAQREHASRLMARLAVLHGLGIEFSMDDLILNTSLHISETNVQ